MTLAEMMKSLNLSVVCGDKFLERDVTGGFSGDLLSDVIAGAPEKSVWITRQIHPNIIAVASLRDVAGIVIVAGGVPATDTLQKALEADVPILLSPYGAFETAGKIYALLGGK
ncbi:MAG: serine kinase [Deltaproteobacteria bacterium]|nr:serine kinase [Deltaproteobacteria bacterium]